jgi:hypothetical protein
VVYSPPIIKQLSHTLVAASVAVSLAYLRCGKYEDSRRSSQNEDRACVSPLLDCSGGCGCVKYTYY